MIIILLWIMHSLCAEHGYSVSGAMKYSKGFKHYDGVNEHAPFGGHLCIGEHGSLNAPTPFVSNVRMGRVHFFDVGSLTARSPDEPMTDYCYCAVSMEVAKDFTSVVFHLREGVLWDQGYGELSVDDVVFSLNTWKKHGSFFTRALYKTVSKVEIIDKKTIRFHFQDPSPTLPSIVGGMPLLCAAFYKKHGIGALYNKPMLALGPYRIIGFTENESMVYEYRQDFWGKDLPIFRGLVNYDKITVRYYKDAEVLRMALVKGEISSIIERDPVYIALKTLPAAGKDQYQHYNWLLHRPPVHHFIVMNARKSYLKDVRVRKALYYIFRYDILSKYCLQGVFSPLESLFVGAPCQAIGVATAEEKKLLMPYVDLLPKDVLKPFAHEGHKDSKGYRWRLEQALHLLKSAGWSLDYKTRRLQNVATGQCFPVLHIYCCGAREKIIADDYRERLKAVGITLIVHKAEMPYLYHIHSSHTLYDFMFLRYPGTYYPGLGLAASFYSHTADRKGSRNYAGICHPAVDSMIDYIRSAKNVNEQTMAARALDRIVMHEYFFIPLFYTKEGNFWAHKSMKFPPFTPSTGYVLMSSYFED